MKQKRYEVYKQGDKVLIQSETYVWGVVKEVTVRHKKHSYKVEIIKGGTKILNKLPEEALLPYRPKWWWKLVQRFKIVV